ncbi:MAG: class II fructose-bisphosphate aldolase family protein [Streptosporangiales bacterium]|nr:class II fructose-bisphosphate aldolase family protein [Streptosporangiales bacterium]
MSLVPIGEIVAPAVAGGFGVGAFNLIQLELAEAIVSGAERAGTPVVLQISQNCVRYHGALEPVAVAALAVARQATMPVVVHLDHAESVELVDEALALGVGSVMFDASAFDYADNVELTRGVASRCHDQGVWVEAELGEVGGKDGAHPAAPGTPAGAHAPGARTDPGEAALFVAATGVDALAVAVGTSHAMVEKSAALDLELIGRLREAVPVPLVLHGSSGVADDDLVAAVAAGITKVNVATQLNKTFTESVRATLAARPDLVDTRKYVGPARDAVAAEVARLLGLITAAP